MEEVANVRSVNPVSLQRQNASVSEGSLRESRTSFSIIQQPQSPKTKPFFSDGVTPPGEFVPMCKKVHASIVAKVVRGRVTNPLIGTQRLDVHRSEESFPWPFRALFSQH